MKKIASTFLVSTLLFTSTSNVLAQKSTFLEKSTVITEQFQIVEEEKLTEIEKAFVNIAKKQKGIFSYGSLFVLSAGQKPNLGYNLTLEKQEQVFEQLKLYVKETKPEEDKFYGDVITYPFVLGRVQLPKYTTLSVIDADNGKSFFEDQKFTLDFKEKQTLNSNNKTLLIHLDKKITKTELKTFHISLTKLDEPGKEIPIKISLDSKKKNMIRVTPKKKYELNTLYLLQSVEVFKDTTKMIVLPFEVNPRKK